MKVIKFFIQLISGVTGFCLFSTGLWILGTQLGANTNLNLMVYSYLCGVLMIYLVFKIFVVGGTRFRLVFEPQSRIIIVNTVLGSIILCTIMGAATLLGGKIIYTEGIAEFLNVIFLPPMYFCFLPTILFRWRAADGEKMTREFSKLAQPFGFKLAAK